MGVSAVVTFCTYVTTQYRGDKISQTNIDSKIKIDERQVS